jgi:hypothetical protein
MGGENDQGVGGSKSAFPGECEGVQSGGGGAKQPTAEVGGRKWEQAGSQQMRKLACAAADV